MGGSAKEGTFSSHAAERHHSTTAGVLWASLGIPFSIYQGVSAPFVLPPPLSQVFMGFVTLLLWLGATLLTRRPTFGRFSAISGIVGLNVLAARFLAASPLATLTALVCSAAFIAILWKGADAFVGILKDRTRPLADGHAQGASLAAFVLWLVWAVLNLDKSLYSLTALFWAMAISTVFILRWALGNLGLHRSRSATLLVTLGITLALSPLLFSQPWWLSSAFAPVSLLAAVTIFDRRQPDYQDHWWEPLLGRPERLLVGTFFALCLGGTLLLILPQSSSESESISFIDALFTSTSAVCVTGLIVLDTPNDFSLFGQAVILLLIQIGGLGIMTFSTAALWALGKRMSLRHEGAVASLISTQDRGRLYYASTQILRLTLGAEVLGALILAIAFFQRGDSALYALWRGLFTSISAFCNAGFALQSDSLIPYQDSPLILHTVGLLIILGGLSPVAVFALPSLLSRSTHPISAQAKLSLVAAGILLSGGFFFYMAMEWNDSLAGLPFVHRVHNAWFQSVTLRTAGFNSVDISVIRPSTLTLMLVWMFIGGSPGGTAGGVKTTTVSVLLLSVVNAIRGTWFVEVFGRRIPERVHTKAAVVVAVAATSGVVALVAVLLTQQMPTDMAVFEVVSALGTVGLSIGGTAELDGIGKAITLLCMFIGRVGGLTLLMFLGSRKGALSLGRPEEEIAIG